MDEFISREAVVRYLKEFSEKELNSSGSFGMITYSVLNKAERTISEMPAADVQPVKHGTTTFEPQNEDSRGYGNTFKCTYCGCLVTTSYYMRVADFDYNYCPYCGKPVVESEE